VAVRASKTSRRAPVFVGSALSASQSKTHDFITGLAADCAQATAVIVAHVTTTATTRSLRVIMYQLSFQVLPGQFAKLDE
jgi:hypothetical protein